MKFPIKLCFPILGILFLALVFSAFALKSEIKSQEKSQMMTTAQAKAESRAHKAELAMKAHLKSQKDYSFGKKSNSMMGYFKMLSLLSDSEAEPAPSNNTTQPAPSNNTPQKNPSASAAQAIPSASNCIQNNETLGKNVTEFNFSSINNTETIEDWLMISSLSFLSDAKFPPIVMGEGQKDIKINVGKHNFRINLAWEHMTKEEQPINDKMFWFRLSLNNIYYSTTASDYNILGAIAVAHIITVNYERESYFGLKVYCFDVEDLDHGSWKLCALEEVIRRKWVCKLRMILGEELTTYCTGKKEGKQPLIIDQKIIQPIVVIPTPSPPCNFRWNYQKNGADWECDCAEGAEQSPIDLPPKEKAIDSPIKPVYYYEEISARAKKTTIDGLMKAGQYIKLRLKDNCLRIIHDNLGKVVTLDGAVYIAQEIVIHTPAEHQIDGKTFDMEIQIVHYGASVGDIAKQVVLSFLFEKKAGVYNKFIDDLDFVNLPNPIHTEVDITNNLFIPKILYNSDDDDIPVMKPFSFYTYHGSLPFPPCTENTIMYVISKPLRIGSTVLQLLQEALRVPDLMDSKGNVIVSNWVAKNSRKIQASNGRPVWHYDHEKYCGPDPKKKLQPVGHYEKMLKTLVNYFYVNGDKPSGIPGAHVVSEKEAKGKLDVTITQ